MSNTVAFSKSSTKTFAPIVYKGEEHFAPECLFSVPPDANLSNLPKTVEDMLSQRGINSKVFLQEMDGGNICARIMFPHRKGKLAGSDKRVVSTDYNKFRDSHFSMGPALRSELHLEAFADDEVDPNILIAEIGDMGFSNLSLQQQRRSIAAQSANNRIAIFKTNAEVIKALPKAEFSVPDSFDDNSKEWIAAAMQVLERHGVKGQFGEVVSAGDNAQSSSYFTFASQRDFEAFTHAAFTELNSLEKVTGLAMEAVNNETLDTIMKAEDCPVAAAIRMQAAGISTDPKSSVAYAEALFAAPQGPAI